MSTARPPEGARSHRGFTLIEMVVVVALVGILAAAAQPMLTLAVRRQHEAELHRALRSLRDAIDAYHQAVQDGWVTPPIGNESGYPPNLHALVDGVPDARTAGSHQLYFLRRLPRDPLAPADVPAAQTWGLRSHDSPPDAPQPGRDVFDVRSLADGVGLDGTAYADW